MAQRHRVSATTWSLAVPIFAWVLGNYLNTLLSFTHVIWLLKHKRETEKVNLLVRMEKKVWAPIPKSVEAETVKNGSHWPELNGDWSWALLYRKRTTKEQNKRTTKVFLDEMTQCMRYSSKQTNEKCILSRGAGAGWSRVANCWSMEVHYTILSIFVNV